LRLPPHLVSIRRTPESLIRYCAGKSVGTFLDYVPGVSLSGCIGKAVAEDMDICNGHESSDPAKEAMKRCRKKRRFREYQITGASLFGNSHNLSFVAPSPAGRGWSIFRHTNVSRRIRRAQPHEGRLRARFHKKSSKRSKTAELTGLDSGYARAHLSTWWQP
jgi:hypothetical protein